MRQSWGDDSVSMIWAGIAQEVAYRSGIEPEEVATRLSLAMQEKYEGEDWDRLLEPVIQQVMNDAGLEDTR